MWVFGIIISARETNFLLDFLKSKVFYIRKRRSIFIIVKMWALIISAYGISLVSQQGSAIFISWVLGLARFLFGKFCTYYNVEIVRAMLRVRLILWVDIICLVDNIFYGAKNETWKEKKWEYLTILEKVSYQLQKKL